MPSHAVNRALAALALALGSLAGCSEDVGECFGARDGGTRGRDIVLIGGQVQYGGQAILNSACAQGCHSSRAKGVARQGAPEGLDFDLVPIAAEGKDYETTTNRGGDTLVVLPDEEIAGLRARQRKVYSERNRIWQQVKDGLMPPDGKFEGFKRLLGIYEAQSEDSPCTRGSALRDIDSKSSQDLLRNWLACQAPIVEAYGGPITGNGIARPNFEGAGYQYAECGGEPGPSGDGGMPGEDGGDMMSEQVTLAQVYDEVFVPTGCVGCHPGVNDAVDLTDLDSSYASLVEDTGEKCEGKPYVTPGEPEQSFLYEIVSTEPACSLRMPLGGELSASQQRLIRDWIAGGALRGSARISPPSARALKLGLDAGAR